MRYRSVYSRLYGDPPPIVDPGDPGGPGPQPPPEGVWRATLRGLPIGELTDYPWRGVGDDPFDVGGEVLYRAVTSDRQQAHGNDSPGPDWMGSKLLTFRVWAGPNADAGTEFDVFEFAADLLAAWRPARSEESDRLELVLDTPWRRLTYFGKPDRKPLVGLAQAHQHLAPIDCLFRASDPLAYGDAQRLTLDTLGAVGGLDLPHGFPHGFGQSHPGRLRVVNAGTMPVGWQLELSAFGGDAVNPSIRLGDDELHFDVTLSNTGPTLLVDAWRRRIYLGDPADGYTSATSRPDLLRRPGSRWFNLEPGTNLLTVSAESGNAAAAVTFRPGWLL